MRIHLRGTASTKSATASTSGKKTRRTLTRLFVAGVSGCTAGPGRALSEAVAGSFIERSSATGLEKSRLLTAARSDYVFAPDGSGARSELHTRAETGAKRYWLSALRKSGSRFRRMHDTRHTDATTCLMPGVNPAFIAARLGQSVQVLLPTDAKWINASSEFAEFETLDLPQNGPKWVPESR